MKEKKKYTFYSAEEKLEYINLIISFGVLYEKFGPPSAKLSLYLSKSYDILDNKLVK